MTTPTREQISHAVAVASTMIDMPASVSPAQIVVTHRHVQAIETLLSAIPALTAELEAEREAHADARARLDSLAKDVGQALVAMTLQPGESLADFREHAIVYAVVGLVKERHAWQSATGHASPEAYRARVEPGADVVAQSVAVFRDAQAVEAMRDIPDGGSSEYCDRLDFAGIRAILSFLALLGSARVGRTEEETGVRVESAIETAYACNGCGLFASDPNDPCAQCDVPRLEAVLGARRALGTCRECHMADQHKLDCSRRFSEPLSPCCKAPMIVDPSQSRCTNCASTFQSAVTAPPTDEQLAEEALRLWPHDYELMNSELRRREAMREAYERGARREGRR